MNGQSNGQAILLMSLGVLLIVLNDVGSKWLVERYSSIQITFVRGAMALPFLVAFAVVRTGAAGLRSQSWAVHALRGILLFGAMYAFILSLRYLSLAAATALIFAAPVGVVVLSRLLGDRVGPWRWAAVLLGFAGVLVIVRPGLTGFEAASFLAVAAAMLHAGIMVTARYIDQSEPFPTMLLYQTAFPVLYASFVTLGEWPERRPEDIWVFAAIAFCGPMALGLMTQAFRIGEASVVAPFDYTALLWATLFGWIVWGAVPDVWTYIGAGIIIVSGIVIIRRQAAST